MRYAELSRRARKAFEKAAGVASCGLAPETLFEMVCGSLETGMPPELLAETYAIPRWLAEEVATYCLPKK